MKIYYGNISRLEQDEIFERKMQLIPEERRLKIMGYKRREDRLRGLCASLLLEYGLRECGLTLLPGTQGKKTVRLESGPHGKPQISGESGIYFNLSHSGAYAAAVFANCESGIDIEQVKKHRINIAKRCFTQDEKNDLNLWSEKKEEINPPGTLDAAPVDFRFTELWTRKESFIKAEGSGLGLPLNQFSVLEDLSFNERMYYFKTFDRIQGYLLSVCGQSPIGDVVPVEIDPEDI